MREAVSDRMTLWNGWLPGQVPNDPLIAEEIEGNTIELEGNELSPGTVRVMREAVSDRMTLWNGWLPGQVPNDPLIAEEIEGNTIELEGNELRVVELGHSDTQDSTCLYVPSIRLAVAGDAAFNSTHPWLAGCPTPKKRKEWISALNKIESLNPRAVIAGYKQPGEDDDPRIIEETRQYIHDFDKLAESTETAREIYDQMLKLYPDWLDPMFFGSERERKR